MDNIVKLWDISSGKEIKNLKNTSYVTSLCFSKNRKEIICGLWNNTVMMWDILTGEPIKTFNNHAHIVTSVNYSPDE